MKIAITATGKEITSDVDPRFGRAAFFLLVDPETNQVQAHDNTQNLNAAQGAGIQAAETVTRLGAQAVLSGNFGPKAFRTLQAAGIRMYRCGPMSVAEALEQFQAGALQEETAANVEGHW